MIKKVATLLLSTLFLASCSKEVFTGEIKWVSPLGAPSIAFYDQYDNSNWVSQAASLMPAELQGNMYDAVVYDSITGLESIKMNDSDFALARVITGGNFYLVGINHTEMPTSTSKIVAFQKDKVPDKVFKKVTSDRWGLDTSNVKYVKDASETAPILKTGKYQSEDVDYVLTAEPVFSANKSAAQEAGITLTELKVLRDEWRELTGQNFIVQAGIFVRKSIIDYKKDKLNEWFTRLDTRLEKLISNDPIVGDEMNEYGDAKRQQGRYGVAYPIINVVQKEGANRLGFVTKANNEELSVNAFLTALGLSTYEDSYFAKF